MRGFTPGPWTANLDSDHGDYTVWGPRDNHDFVANVGTGPESDYIVAFQMAAANALLIAAAPALYAEHEAWARLLGTFVAEILEGDCQSLAEFALESALEMRDGHPTLKSAVIDAVEGRR